MTDRQRAFIVAYLADPRRSATKAAESAGYAWPDKQGSRLKTFPNVAEAIRLREEAIERERHKRKMKRMKAEADRYWLTLPEWYRKGLPRPKGIRGRYKRRRCM